MWDFASKQQRVTHWISREHVITCSSAVRVYGKLTSFVDSEMKGFLLQQIDAEFNHGVNSTYRLAISCNEFSNAFSEPKSFSRAKMLNCRIPQHNNYCKVCRQGSFESIERTQEITLPRFHDKLGHESEDDTKASQKGGSLIKKQNRCS